MTNLDPHRWHQTDDAKNRQLGHSSNPKLWTISYCLDELVGPAKYQS